MTDQAMTLNELRSHTLDKIGVVLTDDNTAEHKLTPIEEIYRDYKAHIDECLAFEAKRSAKPPLTRLFEEMFEEMRLATDETRLDELTCCTGDVHVVAKYFAQEFHDPSAAYRKLRAKGETQGFENAM